MNAGLKRGVAPRSARKGSAGHRLTRFAVCHRVALAVGAVHENATLDPEDVATSFATKYSHFCCGSFDFLSFFALLQLSLRMQNCFRVEVAAPRKHAHA